MIHLYCAAVWVCVSTVCAVYKSGYHQCFYPFFSILDFFFFPSGTIHLRQDRSFSSLCQPLFVELWFTELLNNDPHNSLHEPLTQENKTPHLTWKEMRGGEIHFCCKGDSGSELALITISDTKDDDDFSCWQKPGTDVNSQSGFLTVVTSNISGWQTAERVTRSPTRWRKAQRVTGTDQTPQCRLLTSSSGGACPAFSPHYSYFTASANGHQRAASFCHTPRLHLISLCCVCVRARTCVSL